MRFAALVTLLLLLGAGPLAAQELDGLYRPRDTDGRTWDCTTVGMDGGALRIGDDLIEGVESACRLSPSLVVPGLAATVFNATCAGEGYEWLETVMLMPWEDGGERGVYVIREGHVAEWVRCGAESWTLDPSGTIARSPGGSLTVSCARGDRYLQLALPGPVPRRPTAALVFIFGGSGAIVLEDGRPPAVGVDQADGEQGARIIVRFADSPVGAQYFANVMRRLAAEARVSAGAWQASVDISLTGSARALSDFVTLTGACAHR